MMTMRRAAVGWLQEEKDAAVQFLMSEMGLHLKTTAPSVAEVDLSDEETYMYMKRFQALDTDGKGFITVNDLRRHFKVGCQAAAPWRTRCF